MRTRPQHRRLLPVALAGVCLLLALTVAGLGTGLLLLSPALLLLCPLLTGRYVGERRLVELASRCRPRRRTRPVRPADPAHRAGRAAGDAVRGGRLIAAALAERGPPRPHLA
jgi:hypothetical protein